MESMLQHQLAAGAEAPALYASWMSLNGHWDPGVALQLSPRWFRLDQQPMLCELWLKNVLLML